MSNEPLSNHQTLILHLSPPFSLPPPWWTQLSTLSFHIISALCYFPALCKWHWLADVNSHSAEEMSQSFCVPNSDGSSITKAANTHYTPITAHHSNNCNSIQPYRKAHSGELRSTSGRFTTAYFRGCRMSKQNIVVFFQEISTLETTSAIWFTLEHVGFSSSKKIYMKHYQKKKHMKEKQVVNMPMRLFWCKFAVMFLCCIFCGFLLTSFSEGEAGAIQAVGFEI